MERGSNMNGDPDQTGPDPEEFLAAVGELADSFGWTFQSLTRGEEIVAVVGLANDPSFEQVLWVYDTDEVFLRCLLVSRAVVEPERVGAVLELCARINDGLMSGCLEYSFENGTLIFRDSAQLGTGLVTDIVAGTSSRVLGLGSRYAPAIRATLAGRAPAEAIALAEAPDQDQD